MKQVLIRCSDAEFEQLKQYCAQTERTQNDVLRELIRNLQAKDKKSRWQGEASDPSFRWGWGFSFIGLMSFVIRHWSFVDGNCRDFH